MLFDVEENSESFEIEKIRLKCLEIALNQYTDFDIEKTLATAERFSQFVFKGDIVNDTLEESLEKYDSEKFKNLDVVNNFKPYASFNEIDKKLKVQFRLCYGEELLYESANIKHYPAESVILLVDNNVLNNEKRFIGFYIQKGTLQDKLLNNNITKEEFYDIIDSIVEAGLSKENNKEYRVIFEESIKKDISDSIKALKI